MLWFVSYTLVPFASTATLSRALLEILRQFFSGNANSDVVDPVTGLSRREKGLVKQTWNLVKKDPRSAGIGFFWALFESYPGYQQLFAPLSGLSKDDLAENKFFLLHALKVVSALNLIVESLDDVRALVAILKRTAKSHERLGITEEQFKNGAVVLVDFLEKTLGKKDFNEACRKSWLQTLDVALSAIKADLIS